MSENVGDSKPNCSKAPAASKHKLLPGPRCGPRYIPDQVCEAARLRCPGCRSSSIRSAQQPEEGLYLSSSSVSILKAAPLLIVHAVPCLHPETAEPETRQPGTTVQGPHREYQLPQGKSEKHGNTKRPPQKAVFRNIALQLRLRSR